MGDGPKSRTWTIGPDDDVSLLKGVGPERARTFTEAGIRTVQDLAALFPRRHDRLPPLSTIDEIGEKKFVALHGRILERRRVRSRRRTGGHMTAVLDDGTGRVRLQFFNQGYLFDSTEVGEMLYVVGSVRTDEKGPAITPTFYRKGQDRPVETEETFIPVYPPLGALKPGVLAKLIAQAVEITARSIADPIDAETRSARGLIDLERAIRGIHRPSARADIEGAERRLLYDGFYSAALDMEIAKSQRTDVRQATPFRLAAAEPEIARFIAAWPFRMTDAQRSALFELTEGLAAHLPMRRLLQGDVGSGKTAVALTAAGLVAAGGGQTAILAPTEILARQLHDVATRYLAPEKIGCDLLIGGLPAAERRRVLDRAASGSAKVVIGTQALLSESVAFQSLAFVIVDEQHRFGVRQRRALVQKGRAPHLLVMSATPIPRSLALTLYGDLDLTEMRERPAGRAPVVTEVFHEEKARTFDWSALAARVREGAKAFIIFPAIEAEDPETPSLLREGRAIVKRAFGGIAVKGAHGRQTDEEKAESVLAFRDGRARALFATTVVEVGIDVPDATEIVIVGAQRFGAAQIHQMRGRVGRGGLPGRCILIADAAAAPADLKRLQKLAVSEDGFAIAELDLEERGPGDIMGLRQHGLGFLLPTRADRQLLEVAFADAQAFVQGGREAEATADVLRRWSRRSGAWIQEHRDSG